MQRLAALLDRFPRLAALFFGALAATGFPPLALWPFGLVGIAGFGWLIWRSETWRRAALIGWLFGVAHFTVTNNWIATAFTYQAEMPAALGWAAVPLLSLYLAVFPAIAAGFAKALAPRAGLAGFAPVLGAGWILGEWLRSWVFTGYAWGPLSLMLVGPAARPGAALALPLTGTYALSGLLVCLVTLALAGAMQGRWALAAAPPALIALGMVWPAAAAREGTLPFTLVQHNLRQEEMNDASRYEDQFQRLAALSRPREAAARRLVLWPESAVPDYLEPGYPQRYYDTMTVAGDPAFARRRIARTGGAGALVLTGAVNLQIGNENGRRIATGAYNSVLAIGADGRIAGRYDKAHLVPYGEYLPMRGLLEPLGLSRLVAGSLDFLAGPGPRTLALGPWGRAGIQICYEIVFSGRVVDGANRPDYIFNPSNDGWFGAWGPPQHLAQARMRAAEEGLPVLRATTTGISAVIDARGVVRASIGMGQARRIDGHVPPAAAPTPFARLGGWMTALWGLLMLAAGLVVSRRARD
ncbi:apolipoprotein N-acyltransferase [Qipengyuania sediminis]|uniref:apolipoprotein N-acyltransferase n=1 Tax=Qipengyuania sediminis TaxID=1532023 RepID=UPI0010594508|nr:apolipoprotein N-acyltransferase [Qipengyuania sediminis]